jgi:hypothetical protein
VDCTVAHWVAFLTSSKQAVRERESGERRVFGFGCFREVVLSLALCDRPTEKKSPIPSSPFSHLASYMAQTISSMEKLIERGGETTKN